MKLKDELQQIRRWSIKEISGKITETKKELFTLNQEKTLGQLKNIAQIGQKKRAIARLATVLDEKMTDSLAEPTHK